MPLMLGTVCTCATIYLMMICDYSEKCAYPYASGKRKGKSRSGNGNKGAALFGIWHMPHTDAPYVCIEPWSSLPSRKGVVEDLETQENLQALKAKGYYSGFFTLKLKEAV